MALLLGVCASAAGAQGRLNYGPPGGSTEQVLEIGVDAVRMTQSAATTWLLYRDDEAALYIVDDGQRAYQKVDQAMAEALMEQIRTMQAAVEAQLAMLPPEQREMMRSMMPPVPDYSAASYRVELLQGRHKAAGYACRALRVLKDDKPLEQMCLVSVEALKLKPADLALLKRMSATMSQVAADFGANAMAAVLEEVDGIPVEHRDPGADRAKLVLLGIERGMPPAGRFKVPAGYRQQAMFPGAPQ